MSSRGLGFTSKPVQRVMMDGAGRRRGMPLSRRPQGASRPSSGKAFSVFDPVEAPH